MHKILVLTNGFVHTGVVTERPNEYLVENAKNIRIWGTTKGLGQLALEGRTTETKTDNLGTIHIPVTAVVFIIDCKNAI